VLHVCATPIGNLGDVTLRVLETLRAVDLIAAEDTRRTRKLLAHYDIHTPLTSLFADNEAQKTAYVLDLLRQGKNVALVSDAGQPGISDPGLRLVARVVAEGLPLVVLPGASAPATAVVASGLAADAGFRFVGYLPRQRRELHDAWRAWQSAGGVLVAFEAPRRLAKSLAELAGLAPGVPGAVCRELTKLHEQVVRGTLTELAATFTTGTAVKGEITLVCDLGAPAPQAAAGHEVEDAARRLLAKGLSKRDAAAALGVCLGVAHREAERLTRAVAKEMPRREP
jgi:16S rRNA (cytidine1402-2'-O)-methyltransferase